MTKSFKHFLKDGLLIVFSILLALGVNEWRMRAAQNAELNRAVQDLSAEISSNLASLEGVPDYHRRVAESTKALAADVRAGKADLSKTPMELFTSQDVLNSSIIGGSRPPSNVSWQLAKDRGVAAKFDYALAKSFSQSNDLLLEKLVEFYIDLAGSFSSIELHHAENQAAHLSVLSAQFRELAAREDSLIYVLEENLDQLHATYPNILKQEIDKN